MKVHKVKILKEDTEKEPGTILKVDEDGIRVATNDGVILIETVQFPGKKAIVVKEYIKGNTIKEGIALK